MLVYGGFTLLNWKSFLLLIYVKRDTFAFLSAVKQGLSHMDAEKLDQRSVEKGIYDRADPDDRPDIIPGSKAEDYSDNNARNVAYHSCILKRNLLFCSFFDDQRVISTFRTFSAIQQIKSAP